jgi:biopolymer transport protein TolR
MSSETNDAPLSPAQRSKIRRLSQPVERAPGDEAGELNIVPYLDIITNILVFVLATIAVVFMTNVDITPPAQGGKTQSGSQSKAMNLVLFIVTDGIGVKTSRGGIAPGCDGGGPASYGEGHAVRALSPGQEYDYAGLKKCVKAARELEADWASELNVAIVANGGIEFHTIIDVADAIRTDDDGNPLFPNVRFAGVK